VEPRLEGIDNEVVRIKRLRCVLLHGTSTARLQRIVKDGLRRPFLTQNLAAAYCCAAAAAEYDTRLYGVAAEPVILKVGVQSCLLRPDRSSLLALLGEDFGAPHVISGSSAPATWGGWGEAHWVTAPFDLDERLAEAKRISASGKAFTALDSLRLARSAEYLRGVAPCNLAVVTPAIPDLSLCEEFVRSRWGSFEPLASRQPTPITPDSRRRAFEQIKRELEQESGGSEAAK
jgi:hypothetical protein